MSSNKYYKYLNVSIFCFEQDAIMLCFNFSLPCIRKGKNERKISNYFSNNVDLSLFILLASTLTCFICP